jgi:hypothetical protein
MFMSWNGFPRAIRNLLISKLKNKFSTDRTRTNFFDENDTRPKVIGYAFHTLVNKVKL